ncbi:hypothetical protein WMF28_16275 [Sorangium sp. So ce590]|uniref:hypothetical protein n=1 Tax=Sorangium sp. So ce590 TaxID=3133317 RepID=UPI003F5FB709
MTHPWLRRWPVSDFGQRIYRPVRQLATNEGIRISIEKLAGGPASRVTATPPDKKAYEAGSNPLWDHVISAYPQLRERADCWHQFAVFGGYVAVPGPFALTFLQQFLQDSLF